MYRARLRCSIFRKPKAKWSEYDYSILIMQHWPGPLVCTPKEWREQKTFQQRKRLLLGMQRTKRGEKEGFAKFDFFDSTATQILLFEKVYGACGRGHASRNQPRYSQFQREGPIGEGRAQWSL